MASGHCAKIVLYLSSRRNREHTFIPLSNVFSKGVFLMNHPNVSHEWSEREKSLVSTAARSAWRVLLFGYSGANNTGAEALLLADIDDLRAVLGPQAMITIPSL